MSTSSASRSAAAAGRPAINTHLHKRGPGMRVHRAQTNRRAARVAPRAAAGEAASKEVTGVVFQPFDEVQVELASVDRTDSAVQSFARCDFHPECEAAINEQINVEYNISYVYHAMHAYFDRDNVGLPGMAAYFKDGSEEERSHAEILMTYQNMRGGRVKLGALVVPETDFNHVEKGEALYAMELSLSLEKLNFQKLNQLHVVAERHGDSQMCDFIEGSLLAEQVDDIKKVSAYVSQLRRVGKGHGVYDFDRHFNDGAE